MARTIDNLGIETSIDYARSREQLDETIVKEARNIPMQTQIDVTSPSYPMELDVLFGVNERNIPWADFIAPPKYYEQKKRLFTDQLIPSLGTPEKRTSQLERVMHMSKVKAPAEKPLSWEEKMEWDAEEKEKSALKNLLTNIENLNRLVVEVKALMGQYKKG